MNLVAKKADAIPAVTGNGHELFRKAIQALNELPQAHLETKHNLHAGVYSRTVFIPKGVMLIGTEMQCSTMLVQYGYGRFSDGSHSKDLKGYVVMEGLPHRQCAFLAYEDTWATMYFATKAKTVEEAEKEFCSDPSTLLSNKEKGQ